MNKRTLKIILGAIIAIVVIGVSAKPLFIRYLLYKYDRAGFEMSHIFDNSHKLNMDDMKAGVTKQADILTTLQRLGYLSSYSIPIQSPRADAENALELITTFSSTHKIPTLAIILNEPYPALEITESEPPGAFLNIVDKPEARPFWDMFVRMYLEAPKGQQGVAGYPPQGVGSPER